MTMDKLEYSITFATITPESAENGDFEQTGFEHESIVFDSFESLVRYIEWNGFYIWSEQPTNTGWLSTDFAIDYKTMTEKQLSIHAKNERSQRYLELAYKFTSFC